MTPTAPAATLVMVSAKGDLTATVPEDVPGTEAATPKETFNSIPGVRPQQNTANAIQGFALVIGATVIGVFFYVLTLQKMGQVGILKAIGASSWFVFRQLFVQVVLISAIGMTVALPLTILDRERAFGLRAVTHGTATRSPLDGAALGHRCHRSVVLRPAHLHDRSTYRAGAAAVTGDGRRRGARRMQDLSAQARTPCVRFNTRRSAPLPEN